MDVQTENMDPAPCESQPTGKIRKGFKLFGKRKPGNIFSIRAKGDGNNKSPVMRSKTLDGLSETTAPDSEQEPDKENGHEVSQREREQAEEEQLGEDGVLAAAPARNSISSASSAKSLSFLSLLRGGRRGVGDRRVHTVSQPVGRRRRGLKGLFDNVKFRSKDKEDKEEAPPSPLLMTSRANSVEIIKEDLTLTPKSQPRSLDSPGSESYEPVKSSTAQDSSDTSTSETQIPQVTAGNVSRTNEHVPHLSTSEAPLVPGDTSLSSLLADISSLLTFDSISGGGDIMADVEAEWGKASNAISAVVTEVSPSSTALFSKPTFSSPQTSTSISTTLTAKSSPVVVPKTAITQHPSFSPLTKATSTSSPVAKPSSIITTLTKASTLTTQSVKLSSDSTPASEPSISVKIKSTTPIATKSSIMPEMLASLSAPMSSPSIIKSTMSSISTATPAFLNTPASIVEAPSISPTLTSTVSKPVSEIPALPQSFASVGKSRTVVTPPSATAKPPVTHSYPTPVSFIQVPPVKLDSDSTLNLQTFTSFRPSLSLAAGETKAPVTVSPTFTVTTKPSSPPRVIPTKMTMAPASTTTSGSVSEAHCKPTLTSTSMDIRKAPPSLATVADLGPSSTLTNTTKTQLSFASVPTPSSTLDKVSFTVQPTPAPVSLDKVPPAPIPTPAPITHAVVSTASPTPPALGQIPVSQSKAPPFHPQIPVSVSKEPPAPAQIPVSKCKEPPPASVTASIPKDPPAQIPVSVSKDPPAPAQIPVSQSKVPPGPSPVTSPLSTPAPFHPAEVPASTKLRRSGQTSVDEQLVSPSSTGATGAQPMLFKIEELHNESLTSLQGPSKERRTPQAKGSGLSKIPVVGGGRAGKLPVRDSQQVDDEASRDPPTPVLEEEKPHLNSHDAWNKDKISDVDSNVPTSKHTLEESQQPLQQKVLTSLPRDSKIPVKHSAQSHTASQIPQAKEPPRTKIPVSKVPVRRAGNKPAASGGSTQTRK
ncbi:APC membrane recruitment protein 2-like [Mastacembelus armatus]|uniref:APC membrane recruitment protein 2-like n=1 Tax=Mastacembelus armatus TaxID=205130 RepID=UPI000E462AC7|nr:APC membrane recruitment protein 2-like [Mastacembelus armatus]